MSTFNPYVVTNVQDGFSVQSQGYWQGDLQDDPAGRFQLAAGIVAAAETLPMWGGIAVFEKTPPATPDATPMGSIIGRATGSDTLAGFSVFNGVYSAPTTPQSPVPLQSVGGGFNFVRLGTKNRVVVKCASSILALAGSENPKSLGWDVTNQQLVAAGAGDFDFTATLIDVNTNGATVVYDGVTGFATWNTVSNVAVILI